MGRERGLRDRQLIGQFAEDEIRVSPDGVGVCPHERPGVEAWRQALEISFLDVPEVVDGNARPPADLREAEALGHSGPAKLGDGHPDTPLRPYRPPRVRTLLSRKFCALRVSRSVQD